MSDDKDNSKKGFSGLLDLVSEVSVIDEPIKSPPKIDAKSSASKLLAQPQREVVSSESESNNTRTTTATETARTVKNSGSSGDKWFFGVFGIIGIICVIWIINSGYQNEKKPLYALPSSSQSNSNPEIVDAPMSSLQSNSNPEIVDASRSSLQSTSNLQSDTASVVQTPSMPQSFRSQDTKPLTGTNNLLTIPEIRWCIREGIQIEAMRNIIETNAGIDEFNRIISDFNRRCGSYRYRQGSQLQAERDVEPYRSQIVEEAIREAKKLEYSHQPPHSSTSSGTSTSTPSKLNTQYTREAQQIMFDLGYDPGPVDGDYGRRTADAVKAFQRDAGVNQDGVIDQPLLTLMRLTISQRFSLPPPIVESRSSQ